jgi:hypothetical protein
MKVDLSAAAIEARLQEASRLAGAPRPENRLAAKIDLSGAAITVRLKGASELLEVCRALGRAGAAFKSAAPRSSDLR